MSAISTFAAPESPAMISYRHAMSIYAPELADPSDEVATSSYVATDEMLQGLQLAGSCPTRTAFVDKLRHVTDFTGSGITAPVDLAKPKEPVLCENFVKADPSRNSFATVQPPAALDHHGFWCGQALSNHS